MWRGAEGEGEMTARRIAGYRIGLKRGNNERGGNGQNAPLAARLGIPPLDDDGRSHPCGARVYRSCISSKRERGAGFMRKIEGEGEMTDEDESTDPGIIVAERAILKFLG